MIDRVSVIVPTRNRARSLKELLQSLEHSTGLDSITVEILVVNNGSTDRTADLLKNAAAEERRYRVKALDQTKPGKSAALNLGLSEACGDLLLILDDDVVVDPLCLSRHVSAYKENSFDAVQGRILPGVDPAGRPPDMSRLREYNIPLVDYGAAYREIHGLTGTNMSFTRSVLEKVGFFDPRLGPGASGFSEDTEFSMRISQAGFKIGYTPYAIVYHELNPQRYGSSYNREIQFRKGISRSVYRQDSLMLQVLPDLMGNFFRYLIYALTGRRQKAYKTEGRIAKHCGFIAGKVQERLLRYRRSQ